MRFSKPLRALVGCATVALGLGVGTSAQAWSHPQPQARAVFVQTNDPAGNHVVALERAGNGSLTQVGSYATGGNGAAEANAVVDPLASESSLVYDHAHRLLLATNAGSDTVTVFRVHGSHLHRLSVTDSRGDFPTSIAVRGRHVYVLNAGGDGSVASFVLFYGHLLAVPGGTRSLGLGNASPPDFLHSPGEVGVTHDGRHVVVTTKVGGTVITLGTNWFGRLGAPHASTTAGQVPFALDFDRAGRLVLSEAGSSSLATYRVHHDGSVTNVGAPVSDGGAANCWIAKVGGYYFVANTGSGTISTFSIDPLGTPVLKAAVAATPGGAPIDMAASRDGHYLYVENGATGAVDAFAIGAGGALAPAGSTPGFGAHVFEGIAAT